MAWLEIMSQKPNRLLHHFFWMHITVVFQYYEHCATLPTRGWHDIKLNKEKNHFSNNLNYFICFNLLSLYFYTLLNVLYASLHQSCSSLFSIKYSEKMLVLFIIRTIVYDMQKECSRSAKTSATMQITRGQWRIERLGVQR